MIPSIDQDREVIWAMKNAELLRQGRISEVDATHLAEELEGYGEKQSAGAAKPAAGADHTSA
jgi:hypothetical protein